MAHTFLCEIGCEEIPTSAMFHLQQDFAAQVAQQLAAQQLAYTDLTVYVTPRRLAVEVQGLPAQQADQTNVRQGPSLAAAYDSEGMPTIACMGFLRSCNATIEDIEIKKTKKGSWVCCKVHQPGAPSKTLLPQIITLAVAKLSLQKPMRWAEHSYSFVRPVHWVVMLLDKDVIDATLFGFTAGRVSYGHRVHADGPLELAHAGDYESLLQDTGYVIADAAKRQQLIEQQLSQQLSAPEQVIADPDLLQEVSTLVEWPVVLLGQFDEKYLSLPKEVLTTVMRAHQKCFGVENADGKIQAKFCLVANLQAKNPQHIIAGNQKVMRARLQDAYFFYQQDGQQALADYRTQLKQVMFQQQLGSMADKVTRLEQLGALLAANTMADATQVQQAAALCKCDLVTQMVGELPELQGIMGRYYAINSGQDEAVANAIAEHMLPRHADDELPQSVVGATLAIADRIDTIVGIIGSGQLPTGDKDPFALRRQALALIRIIMQQKIALNLLQLIEQAAAIYGEALTNEHVVSQVYSFILERLRHYYSAEDIPRAVFNAVSAKQPTDLLDFDKRLQAMQSFMSLPAAEALAAASKRVSNILRKQQAQSLVGQVQQNLLKEPAEQALHKAMMALQVQLEAHMAQQQYTQALALLASLKSLIDDFFDQVMVMVEDEALQKNRLHLLQQLNHILTSITDISAITAL